MSDKTHFIDAASKQRFTIIATSLSQTALEIHGQNMGLRVVGSKTASMAKNSFSATVMLFFNGLKVRHYMP